jgi:formylglycine-generating enzyme required for sulfatase activity
MDASTTQLMDFTLSFAESDRPWADWITWVLESEGHTVNSVDLAQLEREDISSFHLIVLLSDSFQADSQYEKLVQQFLIKDRNSKSDSRVLPIMLADYDLPKIFPSTYPIHDPIYLTESYRQQAKKRLLDAAKTAPLPFQPPPKLPFRKPQPPFPGQSGQQSWIKTKERQTAQGYIEKLGDSLQLEMMQIPGGTFRMGQTDAERAQLIRDVGENDYREYHTNELPRHLVTVPTFAIGRYPVTQSQWRFIAGLTAIERDLEADPSQFKGDDRPVEQVSWLEAVEFCTRLCHYTGRDYRLPTEAEWEYACRGKTSTPFHFGETINPEIANYNGDHVYGQGEKSIYREETTPVGSFKAANAFGLYDMHGNVWEWCMDHWHENYEKAPNDASAWLDEHASENAGRVMRGGSWAINPRLCRSASRNWFRAVNRNYFIGFRILSPGRIL